MSYQLKASGIAAHCTMAIAVDPDTNQVKDFASAAVTAAMTVDAGIVIGEQLWDGTARKYFKLSAGQYVAFGDTKPQFQLSETVPECTMVWIGESAGTTVRVFGASSGAYFASVNTGSGGANCPFFTLSAIAANGALPGLPTGTKYLFGFSLIRAEPCFAYRALDTDPAMTQVAVGNSSWNGSFPIDFVGRRNDNATQQNDKIHAVLLFDVALSESDWDALRDDWFEILFEAAGADGMLDATANGGAIASGSATVTAPPLRSITSEPLKDNTGALLANEALVYAAVYRPDTGALVVRKTDLMTGGDGRYTFADPCLQPDIDYLHDWLTVGGARRMPVKAAS